MGPFRFIPVNETTIEQKHAMVSMAVAHANLKEVRISLCNRLPMLEMLIARGIVQLKEVLENFHSSRDLVRSAFCLQLEGHDEVDHAISRARCPRHVFRRLLKCVIYRTDIAHLHHKLKHKVGEHNSKSRSSVANAKRLLPEQN